MNIGKESERIEFKKTTSETKEGIVSIASMLNKHQKGVLYFGVRNDGEVLGLNLGENTERKLSASIREHIEPAFWYQIQTRTSEDSKNFLEISFHGENVPYSAYGRYYQRFADEDRKLTDLELERLFASRRKDYSSWEKADSCELYDSVDVELLEKVIRDGNENGRIRYSWSGIEPILLKLGLINPDSNLLTNAGNVLFSKKSPILLKLAHYSTETKTTVLNMDHFEGNVFECIKKGTEYISSNLNRTVSFPDGLHRKEEMEVPFAAIREIIVNAFAHGKYYSNSTFSISVFSNRIEIFSPGYFPVGFDPVDFANQNAEPIMLNPKIVSTLYKAGLIESFGTGFEKTFTLCNQEGVKVNWENTKNGFRFTFYRPGWFAARKKKTSTQEQILNALRKNNVLTVTELSKIIEKSEKTVRRNLTVLQENNYVQRKDSIAGPYWEIIDDWHFKDTGKS